MPYTLVVHLLNADPVMGEADELPKASDSMVILRNPRRVDGKDIHYLSADVVTVYWPLERVNFIEIVREEEEEKIIGFVRE